MNPVIEKLREEREASESRLLDWLRIPSVSTDSNRNAETRQAGDFIQAELRDAGFEVSMHDTDGHPVVLAEWRKKPDAPTVLVYGHYDVQPEDPIGEWEHPPFDPWIRDGAVVARGATDDKGQLFALVRGIGETLRTRGELPTNVVFLIEGEEEIGSPNLEPFIDRHLEALKADVALVSDCSQFGPGRPAITVGLKGLCYVEVAVRGAKEDLHSGSFGGTIENPANALCAMLGALKDANGRIQIPGFYDAVVDLTPEERAIFAELPFDDDAYRKELDVPELHGEAGFTTLERKGARPTLDVNGIWSGWTGEGAKTVLPKIANAKFSMRLVPDQDPETVAELAKAHLEAIKPEGVTLDFCVHHGASPVLVPRESKWMQAAAQAIEKGFGQAPLWIREGGSIPVVSTFKQKLGIDTILLGLGLPDDGAHAPNEKFELADFHRGTETVVHFLDELAR